MHNELFTIGKFTLHGYSVCIALGFLISVTLCLWRAKKCKKNEDVITDMALVGLIAGFIGAKLLYVIVDFKHFLEKPLEVIGFSGFVVYGGIILGAVGIFVYSKIKKVDCFEYLDFIIPFIAMVQGFGRIGCFMAGCCYGAPTDSVFGVVFPVGSLAPAGIKIWPTQLFSAAGDFIICGLLILFSKYNKKNGNVCILYVILYGIGRFLIECLRNDDRGTVGMFSTSQFISIIMVVIALVGGILLNFVLKKEKKENKQSEEK